LAAGVEAAEAAVDFAEAAAVDSEEEEEVAHLP
jgi:hypothetical protein